MRYSGQWKTTLFLPGVQVYSLRQPTGDLAFRLFPLFVQMLPVDVPPCSVMLMLYPWEQRRTMDYLLSVRAYADALRGGSK